MKTKNLTIIISRNNGAINTRIDTGGETVKGSELGAAIYHLAKVFMSEADPGRDSEACEMLLSLVSAARERLIQDVVSCEDN